MGEPVDDVARMKGLVALIGTEKFAVTPGSEADPLVAMANVETKFGRSKAVQGLRMAIGDIVEMFDDAPAGEVDRLDAMLAKGGAMTLSEARSRFSRKVKALLRRGAIRTATEYYLARNATDAAEPDTASKLSAMLAAYEAKAATNV